MLVDEAVQRGRASGLTLERRARGPFLERRACLVLALNSKDLMLVQMLAFHAHADNLLDNSES